MKVYIGPYPQRITINWHENYMRAKHGYMWEESQQTKFTRLLEKLDDFVQDVANATINKILDKRKRKIKIKVHEYDSWDAGHTIALLALPILKQLAATKIGSPWVDDEDVPENLGIRSDEVEGIVKERSSCDWDDNVHKRWEWVLSEIIWSFEQIILDDYSMYGDDDYHNRVKNGTTLFGKYIQALWD